MYDYYPPSRVCITGDVAEIIKCHYRLATGNQGEISARDLADLARIGNHPFAIEAFENWLSTADSFNIHLLDLFCWEQFAGRKQALIRAQYDIAHESFAPFNCRKLLVMMLSTNEDNRKPSEYKLLRELIADLWAEVLCVPVNPPEKIRVKNLITGALDKLRITRFIPKSVGTLGGSMLK